MMLQIVTDIALGSFFKLKIGQPVKLSTMHFGINCSAEYWIFWQKQLVIQAYIHTEHL